MWHIVEKKFPISLNEVFSLTENPISRSSLSDVLCITSKSEIYFVKRFYRAGKKLRAFFGRSRIRGEWENLFYFHSLGIPTPSIIAYGEERNCFQFKRGALITAAVIQAKDLQKIAQETPYFFRDSVWFKVVSAQIAWYLSLLHKKHFIHYDLKWRNILIQENETPQVYFFDCPLGRKRRGVFYRHGIVKDLKNLDTLAKQYLTRTQRLYFYRQYRGITKLSREDKKFLSTHFNWSG